MARIKQKKDIIKLSAEDLQEFLLRRNTFNYSQGLAEMVRESYSVWLKNIRAKYNVSTAKFEIDQHTGVITPKGE